MLPHELPNDLRIPRHFRRWRGLVPTQEKKKKKKDLRFFRRWGGFAHTWKKKDLRLLVPSLGIFAFSRSFAIRQFEGTNFKDGNSFLKFWLFKFSNKTHLVPNLGFFSPKFRNFHFFT